MLNEKLNKEDDPEILVIEESLEHIKFIGVNNSTVNLIDQSHQHVGMENNCVKFKSVCSFSS